MEVQAGWYPDPWEDGATRFWDGSRWTDRQGGPAATGGRRRSDRQGGPATSGGGGGDDRGEVVAPVPGHGYGDHDGTSYPGSVSPVPTGEHVVGRSWTMTQDLADELSESVETTTGTYAVQEPDGGYDGYAAVGEGTYRSGGIDPYGGQVPYGGQAHGGQVPHGGQGPHGGRAPDSAAQAPQQGNPPRPARARGPVVAIVAIVVVLVLAVGGYGLFRALSDDPAGAPTTPVVTTAPPPSTAPPTTAPPTQTTPPAGSEGSAGGNGDVTGSAYVVDQAGYDLGTSLTGAFPAAGQYTSILRVTERTAVALAAFSPDGNDLTLTITGDGVDEELTDSTETLSFFTFSGFVWYDDPGGVLILEPGDYEMVLTEESGLASAFELQLVAGDGTELGTGDQEVVDLEVGEARLYSVAVDAGQELTVTLSSPTADPLLYIVQPDGWIDTNDDWGSSSLYSGPSLPDWTDSALTVSGVEGEYVLVVTTYAGGGGSLTVDVTIEQR